MLYCEFTELINKEIDITYYHEIIEPLYNSTNLNKQDFVKLLNIDALPESETSIKARETKQRLQAEAREKLAILKKELKSFTETLTGAYDRLNYWKSLKDDDMIKYINIDIQYYKRHIKEIKRDIKELKFIYNV